MKTNAAMKIKRDGKEIIIYVRDWENLPDLSFIADVEIRNLNPKFSAYSQDKQPHSNKL